jgi:hypothetical protein
VSEGFCGLFESAVDGFKARLRCLDEQRERSDGGSQHRGSPRERELDVPSGEHAPDRAARAYEH